MLTATLQVEGHLVICICLGQISHIAPIFHVLFVVQLYKTKTNGRAMVCYFIVVTRQTRYELQSNLAEEKKTSSSAAVVLGIDWFHTFLLLLLRIIIDKIRSNLNVTTSMNKLSNDWPSVVFQLSVDFNG